MECKRLGSALFEAQLPPYLRLLNLKLGFGDQTAPSGRNQSFFGYIRPLTRSPWLLKVRPAKVFFDPEPGISGVHRVGENARLSSMTAYSNSTPGSVLVLLSHRASDTKTVVIDLQIPIRNGVELVRQVSDTFPDASVIAKIRLRSGNTVCFQVQLRDGSLCLSPHDSAFASTEAKAPISIIEPS